MCAQLQNIKSQWQRTDLLWQDEGKLSIGYFVDNKVAPGSRDNAQEIKILRAWEALANSEVKQGGLCYAQWIQFHGSANCRCCGKANGSGEIVLRVKGLPPIKVPEGYAHTLTHGIDPDPRIIAVQQHINAVVAQAVGKSPRNKLDEKGNVRILNYFGSEVAVPLAVMDTQSNQLRLVVPEIN